MKCKCKASSGRRRGALVALALGIGLRLLSTAVAIPPLLISPATAQTLLEQGMQDPDAEWNPLDILQAIRDHFTHMPYGWWIREPEKRLDGYEVEVHIPDRWKGNPTAAVNQLCPDRRSRIWKGTTTLNLRPFYLNRPWPGVQCYG